MCMLVSSKELQWLFSNFCICVESFAACTRAETPSAAAKSNASAVHNSAFPHVKYICCMQLNISLHLANMFLFFPV